MKAEFISSLPDHFHRTISSPVKTMGTIKKGTIVGPSMIYNMEAIFLRLIAIGQTRRMELAPIYKFELCAVPPSLTSLDVSGREQNQLAASMKRRLDKCTNPKIILVFDKYQKLSPKAHERIHRAGVGSTDYNLNFQTQLPRREAIMKNKNN